MKTCLWVNFLLVAVAIAHPAIDKGAKTPHQAPFMVSLQIDRQGNGVFTHTCGGSILNPEWVLTAAHCVTENGLLFEYQIVAGQHSLSTESGNEQRRRVAGWDIHENFVSGPVVGPYDVMVLHLESPLNFITGIVGAISLPAAGNIPTGDVQLFGWGSTSTTNVPSIPDILQTVHKDIIPLDMCREIVNAVMDHEPLHTSNVCTGPLNSIITACSGDSGGPIVQGSGTSLEIVGIASWISAFPCGAINAVSVYVRVSYFVDWISTRVN